MVLVAFVVMAVAQTATGARADAATATGSWKATLSSNGTGVMSLFATGKGSIVLALKGLPRSGSVSTAILTGTCARPLVVIVKLPTYRATSAGRLAKTRSLSASVMTSVQAAGKLVLTVRSGTWYRCAAFKGGLVIPTGGFGPGTKSVGTDVKAGTYRIRVPASGCYWERVSGLGGTFDELIAVGYVAGYAVVTIAPTDVAFKSDGCGIWSSDLSAVTKTRTAFGEGTFIVGVDMQSGRYQSSATAGGCSWRRLSGFGGTFNEIIANDYVDGPTIVDIAAGDKGFASDRCGDWTLVP